MGIWNVSPGLAEILVPIGTSSALDWEMMALMSTTSQYAI